MLKLTHHAQEAVELRGLEVAWIEATVVSPDKAMADLFRSGVTRSYKVIAAAGGRILRVAHRQDGPDVLVITAHFDRDAKL